MTPTKQVNGYHLRDCFRFARPSHDQVANCDFTREPDGIDAHLSLSSRSRRLPCLLSSLRWSAIVSLFLFLIASTASGLAEGCQFPSHWAGTWFQKGVMDPIKIIGQNISEKGFCRENAYDKYVIESHHDGCLRCLVITEKHINVLQYKETFCLHKNKSLGELCSEITGDAPLFSLFRLDTRPVKCPFQGPHKFTYSRGHGECKDPLSSIESCTDDAHIIFKFQACADVQGSESRVETLECLADWKDGPVRYLVGKLSHTSTKTEQDQFRCFVFEKQNETSYLIAQSSDATCDGLLTPTEGSRTMKVTQSEAPSAGCNFPSWFSSHRHWRTLDGMHIYDFLKDDSFRVFNTSSGGTLIRFATCMEENNSEAFKEFTVHSTFGCNNGYVCMRIFKRSNHIVEIQVGEVEQYKSDACTHLKTHSANFVTLTTLSPELQKCPVDGTYAVSVPEGEGALTGPTSETKFSICSEQSFLASRCESNEHMQLISRCGSYEEERNFFCHGGWTENNTNYLIVSSKEDELQYCLIYNEDSSSALRMTLSSANCRRHYPVHHHHHHHHKKNRTVTFDLINRALCHTSRGVWSSHISPCSFLLKFLFVIFVTFVRWSGWHW